MTARTTIFLTLVMLVASSLPFVPAAASSDGYTLCAVRRGECKCHPPGGDVGMFVTLDMARCTPSTPQNTPVSAPASAPASKMSAGKDAKATGNDKTTADAARRKEASSFAADIAAKIDTKGAKPASNDKAPAASAKTTGSLGKPAVAVTAATTTPVAQSGGEPTPQAAAIYADGYKLCAIRRGECKCQPPGANPGVFETMDPKRCVPSSWPAETVAPTTAPSPAAATTPVRNAEAKATDAPKSAKAGKTAKQHAEAVKAAAPATGAADKKVDKKSAENAAHKAGPRATAAAAAKAPVAVQEEPQTTASIPSAAPPTAAASATETAKKLLNPLNWLPSIQSAAKFAVPTAPTYSGGYRLCARRHGVCSCQLDKAGPGEYTQVDESHCEPTAENLTLAPQPQIPAVGKDGHKTTDRLAKAADEAAPVPNPASSAAEHLAKVRAAAATPRATGTPAAKPAEKSAFKPESLPKFKELIAETPPAEALKEAAKADEKKPDIPAAHADLADLWPTSSSKVSMPTTDEKKSEVPPGSVYVAPQAKAAQP